MWRNSSSSDKNVAEWQLLLQTCCGMAGCSDRHVAEYHVLLADMWRNILLFWQTCGGMADFLTDMWGNIMFVWQPCDGISCSYGRHLASRHVQVFQALLVDMWQYYCFRRQEWEVSVDRELFPKHY